MKTKLLKSLLFVAFGAMSFVLQAQSYDVKPTGDGIISDAANIDAANPSPYLAGNTIDGTSVLKVGKSGSGGGAFSTNAIIPFELPARPEGKKVEEANLKINIAYMRDWISSDIDLYGLPYNASNTISTTDFYDGTYADGTSTVTGIQDAYFVRDVPTGSPAIFEDRLANSSVSGAAALAAYINAQYDAGAVAGDFVFLRLSIDGTAGSAPGNYYGVSDESTEEAPVLTLNFDTASPTGDIVETITGDSMDTGVNGNVVNENATYPAPKFDVWLTRPVHYIGGLKQQEDGVEPKDLANYDGIGVIPFLLPNIPSGYSVEDVSFSVNLESPSAAWGVLNCDLYGIDARDTSDILETDFYAGDYQTDGTDTAIQDDFIPNEATAGIINSNASGNENLKTFIKAQYNNGKAGKYVFFRINPDAINITTYLRVNVSSADHTTAANKPSLKITFSPTLAVKSFENSVLSLYPNPVKNGVLNVSLNGFSNAAKLQIYSITGQMVHSEKVEVNSRNSAKINLNLSSGLYIVKLEEGAISKTQKLIVQ
mgnify:CR=1 FL=1